MEILNRVLVNMIRPFIDLAAAPRAIWYVIGAFVIDSIAYFGMLTLMTIYLSHDLGWGDSYAGITVSLFTMLVTLAMLGIGSIAESFGLRRAMLGGLAIATIGRAIYCLAPDAPGIWIPACHDRLLPDCHRLQQRAPATDLLLGRQAIHRRENQFDGLRRDLCLHESGDRRHRRPVGVGSPGRAGYHR